MTLGITAADVPVGAVVRLAIEWPATVQVKYVTTEWIVVRIRERGLPRWLAPRASSTVCSSWCSVADTMGSNVAAARWI